MLAWPTFRSWWTSRGTATEEPCPGTREGRPTQRSTRWRQAPSLVVSLTSHEKLSGTHLYFTHKETGSEFVKEVLRVLERGLVATCPRMPASSELVSLSTITQHGAQRQEERKTLPLDQTNGNHSCGNPRIRPSPLCTWTGSQEPTTWHQPLHGTACSHHAALGSPLGAARPVLKGRAPFWKPCSD